MSDNAPAAAPTREQIATWRRGVQGQVEWLESWAREQRAKSTGETADDLVSEYVARADSLARRASHWRALDALLDQFAARVGMTETTEQIDDLFWKVEQGIDGRDTMAKHERDAAHQALHSLVDLARRPS